MARCSCYNKHGLKYLCYGTKEMEECSCGGDTRKCNFYPEKREQKMATEKRLIDANVVIAKLKSHHDLFVDAWGGFRNLPEKDKARVDEISSCIAELFNVTTVDAVEVVHAQWLYDSGSGKYFCSACDEYALSFKKDTLYGGDLYEVCLTDYCPNCGAKMDGDRNV